MHLRLIKLNKFGGVLTIPNHAKMAAKLLEEQDFYKVATGAISAKADDNCDGTKLAIDADNGGTVYDNEFHTHVFKADSNVASAGMKDGTQSCIRRDGLDDEFVDEDECAIGASKGGNVNGKICFSYS